MPALLAKIQGAISLSAADLTRKGLDIAASMGADK